MPSLQVVENFPHLQAASRLPVRNDALHRPLQQAAPFLFQAIEGAQCVVVYLSGTMLSIVRSNKRRRSFSRRSKVLNA